MFELELCVVWSLCLVLGLLQSKMRVFAIHGLGIMLAKCVFKRLYYFVAWVLFEPVKQNLIYPRET